MAFVGMMKDVERDPSLAKRYGISLTGDQYDSMKEKVKEIEQKKKEQEEKNKKNKKGKGKKASTSVPTVPILPAATKPIVYEWKEIKTSEGKMYYWNKKTGETQWERPQGSIQPANDSECVSKEKERLDQFVFNRLVELSESGSAEASAAVCRAFDADPDDRSPSPPAEEPSLPAPQPLVYEGPQPEMTMPEEPEEKRPRINLLGEWQPVIPE